MKKITLLTYLFLFLGIIAGKAQIIATYAGNGTVGFSGDGGAATSAELHDPGGLTYFAGNLYISDLDNSRIRMVNASGIISTFAGNGTAGYSGDGGAATSAEINTPKGLAVDTSGNIYIADEANNRIRKVNTTGIISTYAGNGTAGYSGDGGAATSAKLDGPYGIAIDASGNLYIADALNNRIRKVNTSGTISTIAGNGTAGYSGDGGAATSAELNHPINVSVDASGNIYIVDYSNNRIRMVNTSGTISTIVGNGTAGFSGDGGAATSAEIDMSTGIAKMDGYGNLYIADDGNNRIRMVNSSGIITTVAGTGTAGFSGDGGLATSAKLSSPDHIEFDNVGNYYISDAGNNRVRIIYLSLKISTSVTNNVTCNGGSNGSATITATEGTTPYTYSWVPGGQSTSSVSGLTAGIYTITVTDRNGINGSTTATIIEPTYLSVNASAQGSIICIGNTDSLSSFVSGGVSPYTYSWSPTGGLSCTTCSNPIATPTVSRTYTLIVTDHNGCSNTSSVLIDTSCAGKVCSYPYTYRNNDTAFTITDSVTWLSYTPDSANVSVEIFDPSDTNSNYVDSAIFYSGSCGTLSYVGSFYVPNHPRGVGAPVVGTNLSIGTNYRVKLLSHILNHSPAQISIGILYRNKCSCSSSSCNNLVPNGNFESYCNATPCDYALCISPFINFDISLSCWDNPVHPETSPDYYNSYCNSCTAGNCHPTNGNGNGYNQVSGVPNNTMNDQFPGYNAPVSDHTIWSGPYYGYAGIIAQEVRPDCQCSGTTSYYDEYLQDALSSPLTAGHTYNVTFWICLAPNSSYYVSPQYLGIYLSSSAPTTLENCTLSCPSGPLLDYNGHYIPTTDPSNLITCQSAGASTNQIGQWVQVTQSYAANGTEQWLTIGDFYNYDAGGYSRTSVPLPTSSNDFLYPDGAAYYYIDDVSIVDATNLSINVTSDDGYCPGSSHTLTPSGSIVTGGASYSWSNGATTSSITVAPNGATTYSLTVTTSGGCKYYASYTIPVVNITYTGPRSTCDPDYPFGDFVFGDNSSAYAAIPLSASVSGLASYALYWSINLPSPASIENNGSASPTLYIPNVGTSDYPGTNWGFWSELTESGFELSCQACEGSICCTQTFIVAGCCGGVNQEGAYLDYELIDADVANSSTLNTTNLNTSSSTYPSSIAGYNNPSYSGYNVIVDSTASACNCWVIEGVHSGGSAVCQTLGIMGTLNVDQNLLILNSDITFGGLSSVVLSNGAKLTIDNSHLHACGAMWDGIYVPNGCNVVVENGSVIEEASQAAIVSVDGGGFNVTNSTLNDNYVGIQVEAYAGSHGGYISNSQILNNNISGSSNYPPYNNKVNPSFTTTFSPLWIPDASDYPVAGILIDSVHSITIGDPTSSFQNLFQNQYTGISTYNSNVNIYNNEFSDMLPCATCSNNSSAVPACIYARGNNFTTPNTVNIGSSSLGANYKNYLNKSVFGVYSRDTLNLNIISNEFGVGDGNGDQYGVYYGENYKTRINISTNAIENITLLSSNYFIPPSGIVGFYNPYCISIMQSNDPISTSYNHSYGVLIAEASPKLGTIYEVNDNTISGFQFGVYADGIEGGTIKGNGITTNSYLSSGSNEGVYVSWGVGTSIYNNTVTGNSNGDGIRMDYTYGVDNNLQVTCNKTYTTYYGLYFNGPQSGIYIDANSMNSYSTHGAGLYMGATANIPTQGSAAHGTTNTWNRSNACTPLSAPPATYSASLTPGLFHVTATSCPGDPSNNQYLPLMTPITFQSGAGSDCYNCTEGTICVSTNPCNTCVIRLAAGIIQSITPYNYSSASHWMEKFELYSSVLTNDTLYIDSTTMRLDTVVHLFMDSVASSNMGYIYGVLTALGDTNGISSTDIGSANSLLSSISSPDTVESTFKQVLQIYTNMLSAGQNTPDSAQAVTLKTIAPLCPEQYGPAVYSARALLASVDSTLYVNQCELLPDSTSRDFLKSPANHSDSVSNYTFNLYPNPNNGNFTIAYNVGNVMGCKVELYDAIGESVGEYTLANSEGTMNISNPMLANGVYIWKIYANNQVLKYGKVIIMK